QQPRLTEATLDAGLHDAPDMHQARTHVSLAASHTFVGHHQLEYLEPVSAAQSEQVVARGEWIGMRHVDSRIASFVLLAAQDETAADRVVVLLAQRAAIGIQRRKAHAVRVPRQAL